VSYATIQDANDLYGETYVLTSVDRDDDGEPDLNSLTKAFAQASSEMDTYLGVRYDVPVDPVPDVLKRYCVDIGLYQLSSGAGGGLTDEKRRRYEDAIKWLSKLAKADVSLGLPEGSGVEDEPLPRITESPRLFTRSKLDGLL
jgi:phage gp36-like protein